MSEFAGLPIVCKAAVVVIIYTKFYIHVYMSERFRLGLLISL